MMLMAKFKCMEPPKTVEFRHGRQEPEVMEFTTGHAKKVDCSHCIAVMEMMEGFERTE